MSRNRTAEELRRLGERRMNTAIWSVAIVYGLVTLATVAGAVALAVYVVRALLS